MNINKKRGRPTNYAAYSRDYDKVAKEMAKRGYTMADRKLTKMEWERTHYAYKNTRLIEIKEGKRKTVGNINRDIIKSQQWEYTSAQARAQRRSYEIRGGKKKLKISDIKAGTVQAVDWNQISIREKELRAKGYGWAKVHTTISEEFFGS